MAAVVVASLGTALDARADDLTGADRLMCSSTTAVVCTEDGECEKGAAWEFQVPQFIEVDVKAKRLSSTRASGVNRATVADVLRRDEGSLVLQGFEKGRAFSIVIHEKSGAMTAAVARDGVAVTVFGSCTPASAAP